MCWDQGFLTVHWSVSVFHKIFDPESPRDGSLGNVISCHSLLRDEPLLEEWYSWTFPHSQIHIQIFHRIARWFSVDFPDHGEDGFHTMRSIRRYVEVVVPFRFRTLSTLPVNWRTGSVCNGLHPNFIILANRFFFVVPGLSLRIVGVSMRRVSPLLFHPAWKTFNNVECTRVQKMSLFSVTWAMRWSHELVTRHRWLRAHTKDWRQQVLKQCEWWVGKWTNYGASRLTPPL